MEKNKILRSAVGSLVGLAAAVGGCSQYVHQCGGHDETSVLGYVSNMGAFHIVASDIQGIKSIELYDNKGNLISSVAEQSGEKRNHQEITIDISDGRYRLKVTDLDGNVISRKFTKKGKELTPPFRSHF